MSYETHPDTKIVFKGYKLPFIDDVKKIAIKCHKRIPNVRFVSWDFTINSNNKIVLIEANMHSHSIWFAQMANGKGLFGEYTAEMLQKVRK